MTPPGAKSEKIVSGELPISVGEGKRDWESLAFKVKRGVPLDQAAEEVGIPIDEAQAWAASKVDELNLMLQLQAFDAIQTSMKCLAAICNNPLADSGARQRAASDLAKLAKDMARSKGGSGGKGAGGEGGASRPDLFDSAQVSGPWKLRSVKP
jgi:hypothetical protein